MIMTIEAHITLFKRSPVLGEKLTIGRREWQVCSIGNETYELVETFFL